MKWNKINWKKTHLKQDNDGYTVESWEKMFKTAGLKTDGDGNFINGTFTWENGLKAGLPLEQKKYLCYFRKNKSYSMCYYDDENTTPCFWPEDYSETVFPDAWSDVSGENPLK